MNADPDIADSELLTIGLATPPLADLSAIPASGEDVFLDNSLSGGAITGYDALGAPVNVQLRWAKVDNAVAVVAMRGTCSTRPTTPRRVPPTNG